MSKLGIRQGRDRISAVSRRIALHSRAIARTFPSEVSPEARGRFIEEAQIAIDHYLALMPRGKPARRTLLPHRPNDADRHAFIGDLYDAYITARNDDVAKRGFKRTADTVLRAAGLSFAVTDHDLANVRAQRGPFVDHVKGTPDP
jgi:hypothetical protein